MRKLAVRLLLCMCLFLSGHVFAMLSMELTRGVAGAIPIAITPFVTSSNELPEDVSSVISNDLKNSGRFRVYNDKAKSEELAVNYYRGIGVDTVVLGQIQVVGADRYRVNFKLLDVFKGKKSSTGEQQAVLLNQSFTVSGGQLRSLAHHISDLIYRQILGVRGVFSTRLTYVVVQRPPNAPARYLLEVADQDGYNPRPLLTSSEPIMSPAWSPDGKKIAYVSFENKRASIYVQDVATGARRRVSSFQGINGAPAWSPDGSKLALVLSKDGSPNIYVLNIASGQLTRLTHDWGINTEPSWAPDGKSIIFTSNRSGGPQIYQKNLRSGSVTRLTYEGNYNARASFTPDGNHIVLLNQQDKLFNIGILDLNSGVFRVLTNASGTDNESPSVAPNGSMVLYGTLYGGRSILAMTASDASVQIRLPARNGEVQDPAWSPFLG